MTDRRNGLATWSLLTLLVVLFTAGSAAAQLRPAATSSTPGEEGAHSTPEVRVTPRHDLVRVRASSGWHRVRFNVRNLDASTSVTLACGVAGAVGSCRLDENAVQLGVAWQNWTPAGIQAIRVGARHGRVRERRRHVDAVQADGARRTFSARIFGE